MASVQMSARRWFWGLTLGLALWMALAVVLRVDTPVRANFDIGEKVLVPLLPLKRLLTVVQGGVYRLTSDVVGPRGEEQNVAKLEGEIRRLENENYMLANQLDDTRRRYYALEGQHQQQPEVKYVVANIASIDMTAARQLCSIDRGTASGIRRLAIVKYDSVPLGKVISEGPFSGTVLLVSDRERLMRINGQLQRRTPSGIQIIADTCQVHGVGKGMLASEAVAAVHTIPPAVGDIVVVHNDPDWRPMDGAMVGVVTAVAHLEGQPLLYDLQIRPAVDIKGCPFVLVQKTE